MALPPWTVELIRRGLSDVAARAGEPDTIRRWKRQASGLLQELPETAARGIRRVMDTADAGRETVERWSRRQGSAAVPFLNASGILDHPWGSGVPIADATLAAAVEWLRGDVISDHAADDRLRRVLAKAVPTLEGVEVCVTHNFPAALSALCLLGGRRPLVVHRHHAVRLADGTPLPLAFGTGLPVVTEVGAVDRVDAEDFAGIADACVVTADDGSGRWEPLPLGDGGAIHARILEVGTVADRPARIVPSAESTLRDGAQLVVMPGDGIAAGPPCGLIFGPAEELDVIRQSAAWPALRAGQAVHAMLAEAWAQPSPIDDLIATSPENLKSRAERMATRLSGCESIASARVTAEDARVTGRGCWKFPSRQVELTHRSRTPEQWARHLAGEMPAIAAAVAPETLRIDLRWVNPADDARLAEALARG